MEKPGAVDEAVADGLDSTHSHLGLLRMMLVMLHSSFLYE